MSHLDLIKFRKNDYIKLVQDETIQLLPELDKVEYIALLALILSG